MIGERTYRHKRVCLASLPVIQRTCGSAASPIPNLDLYTAHERPASHRMSGRGCADRWPLHHKPNGAKWHSVSTRGASPTLSAADRPASPHAKIKRAVPVPLLFEAVQSQLRTLRSTLDRCFLLVYRVLCVFSATRSLAPSLRGADVSPPPLGTASIIGYFAWRDRALSPGRLILHRPAYQPAPHSWVLQ